MAKKKISSAEVADAVANQFVYEGKKYNVVHGIIVHSQAGQQKLTPADICVHEEAQKILVDGGSSAIEEVIE